MSHLILRKKVLCSPSTVMSSIILLELNLDVSRPRYFFWMALALFRILIVVLHTSEFNVLSRSTNSTNKIPLASHNTVAITFFADNVRRTSLFGFENRYDPMPLTIGLSLHSHSLSKSACHYFVQKLLPFRVVSGKKV